MCLPVNDVSVAASRLLDFTDYTLEQQSVQSRLQIRIKHVTGAITLHGMQAERTPSESCVTATAASRVTSTFDGNVDIRSQRRAASRTLQSTYMCFAIPDVEQNAKCMLLSTR